MLEEKINHQNYVKKIINNLEKIHYFLNKKAIEKKNLVYRQAKNSSNDNTKISSLNINDTYNEIENSFRNRLIRFYRFLRMTLKIILYSLLIILPVVLFLIYFYRFELLIILISYDWNTYYLNLYIDFISSIIVKLNNLTKHLIDFFILSQV